MAPVAKAKNKVQKTRRKGKKSYTKNYLASPADWDRFNAWAAEASKPRKYPVPKPPKRKKVPLAALESRIGILSQPSRAGKVTSVCKKSAQRMKKAALRFVPSRRLKKLAKPHKRLTESQCKSTRISRKALRYVASEAIKRLAEPNLRDNEDCCRDGGISKGALKHETTDFDNRMAKPKTWPKMTCQNTITKSPEMNEWVEYLALPSYRVLKTQNTEKAKRWRQQLVQEIEVRRKQAYGEYLQRNQGMLVEFPPEDEKSKESRNREKNWWRVQIKDCKQFPKPISEAAKKFPGSEFVNRMAQPVKRKYPCRKNPFRVSEKAKTYEAGPETIRLAIPKHQNQKVERKPTRDRDKYGRYIFKMPEYGKRIPKLKKFETSRTCKDNLEEDPSEQDSNCNLCEDIDPIAFQPTVDPLFDPRLAKRQAKERQRAIEQSQALAEMEAESNKSQQDEQEKET